LPQYSEIILGKIAGKVYAGIYLLFFFGINLLVVREASDFLANTTLMETPVSILNLIIILTSGYAAAKGIEVIARMAQFVLPLFLLFFVLIFMFSLPHVDWERLLPLFEGGLQPLVQASIAPASGYGEIVVLAMLLPLMNKPHEVKRKAVWAISTSALLLTMVSLLTLSVYGPSLAGSLLFPVWNLVRMIEYGKYIQRVEGLIVPIWLTVIILKSALFYHLSSMSTARIFGLKSEKPVFYLMVPVLFLATTFLFGNTVQLAEFQDKYWPPFALLCEIGLPLLLLIIAVLRKKKEEVRQ
jgi:spore germination protein KB